MVKLSPREIAKIRAARAGEIRAARRYFPHLDITEAYKKYMASLGQQPTWLLSTGDTTQKKVLGSKTEKPCD